LHSWSICGDAYLEHLSEERSALRERERDACSRLGREGYLDHLRGEREYRHTGIRGEREYRRREIGGERESRRRGYLHHLGGALLVEHHLSADAADQCTEACLDCSETSNAS